MAVTMVMAMVSKRLVISHITPTMKWATFTFSVSQLCHLCVTQYVSVEGFFSDASPIKLPLLSPLSPVLAGSAVSRRMSHWMRRGCDASALPQSNPKLRQSRLTSQTPPIPLWAIASPVQLHPVEVSLGWFYQCLADHAL